MTRTRTAPTTAAILALASLGSSLPSCGGGPRSQGGSGLAPAEARVIAQEAYVFGLPLVYFAAQQDVMTNVAAPEGDRAPINRFVHFREFPDPSNRTVVAWNVDTLYSIASLDLATEPLILSIPPMGDRWWLMQILDAWNDVPAAPGTRTFGNGGGDFALCGPSFRGTLPAGVKEVRIDTSLCALGGRTYTAGKSDYAAVHAIQDRYALTPLSKWRTPYVAPASVPVKPGVDAKTPVGEQVFGLTGQAFFRRLCDLMVDNPPRMADAPVLARIARLGIAPGARFEEAALDPAVRVAVDEGVADARKSILDSESRMGREVNGWVIALDVGRYGTDYLKRAAWTYFAIGANLPEDAVYPNTKQDGDGQPLDAANRYVLRFAPGAMPPVSNFWSLTMYDADGYLVANPLDRHAVGDRSRFALGDDGSLTIYIQSRSPGPEHEANWLPTPEAGPFKLYLRLYGPQQPVLAGAWAPPPVIRVEGSR